MKYCIDCGYECSDDAKFCGMCGYAFEVVPEAAASNKVFNIRKIWSLMAAVVCILPFLMEEFVYIEVYYYKITDNFLEFCQRYGDQSYCDSLGEHLAAFVTAILPYLVIALSIVLVINVFEDIHKVRGILVKACCVATIVMFIFALGEGGDSLSFKSAFLILVIGLVLSVISCYIDKPQPHAKVVYGADGLIYSTKRSENGATIEGSLEWRCPKCDSRNSMSHRTCKTCSTSRPSR